MSGLMLYAALAGVGMALVVVFVVPPGHAEKKRRELKRRIPWL